MRVPLTADQELLLPIALEQGTCHLAIEARMEMETHADLLVMIASSVFDGHVRYEKV